jgi:hypothetical protein
MSICVQGVAGAVGEERLAEAQALLAAWQPIYQASERPVTRRR